MKTDTNLSKKIDGFAQRYRLWLVIPLIIIAISSSINPRAGIGILIFFASIWGIWALLSYALKILDRFLLKHVDDDTRKHLLESLALTLFLGTFAAIGIVLRSENLVSAWVKENMPIGASIGFIDPIFAAICIACVWIYTILQIRNK